MANKELEQLVVAVAKAQAAHDDRFDLLKKIAVMSQLPDGAPEPSDAALALLPLEHSDALLDSIYSKLYSELTQAKKLNYEAQMAAKAAAIQQPPTADTE